MTNLIYFILGAIVATVLYGIINIISTLIN